MGDDTGRQVEPEGFWAHLRRFAASRNRSRSRAGVMASTGVCLVCGLMISVSAVNAGGSDLRPTRHTDLVSLVRSESARNTALAQQLTDLRGEVDRLAAERNQRPDLTAAVDAASEEAALTPVTGPALTVTLDDAPEAIQPVGVDADALVVHQGDIQAVANALWLAGAEAMTIQGVRVVSTTGIKCVGNTVVLHGVPYAPPYVITAIGDPARMQASLDASEHVRIYRQYVDAYQLGWSVRAEPAVRLPGHQGSVDLAHARPVG